MGQEISRTHFKRRDFQRFKHHLDDEARILEKWFAQGRFSHREPMGGFELEAWLVDRNFRPAALNEQLLAACSDPLVCPELARFNIEFNVEPAPLTGQGLTQLYQRLAKTWSHCTAQAQRLGLDLAMIGILPTVTDGDLTLSHISRWNRYKALNEQVLRARHGQPLQIDIRGREHLTDRHRDVMLESATTSFQIHMQVPCEQAHRAYNASLICSAASVALGANSPFLFGKDLWEETRIPLFEQAVDVGGFDPVRQEPVQRVTFGTGYARHSIHEVFMENLACYPPLIPTELDDDATLLPYTRLHNGTIWRWTRPLIGFDDDGTPHIRIEHRVIASGPSLLDCVANAAFVFGLMKFLIDQPPSLEDRLPFTTIRDNFYAAARHGLAARVQWPGLQRGPLQELISEHLLCHARQGLDTLGIDTEDIRHFLEPVAGRVRHARTGSAWQHAFVARHGRDWTALTREYLARQNSGEAVYNWKI